MIPIIEPRAVRVVAAVLLALAVGRAEAVERKPSTARYALTIETVLPHLEENLRYQTTRSQRCLNREDLMRSFPALQLQAFQGCQLDGPLSNGATVPFNLRCSPSAGTSGTARWRFAGDRATGVLNVKMGGKNMTFEQRVAAHRIGPCDGSAGE